ncbi:MAG: peptidase C1 [Podoviridae sp. ctviO18]|nr:MAG: peptidase C1 [Podoviridae sp. ctviO18]
MFEIPQNPGFIPRGPDSRDVPYRAANNLGAISVDWNKRTNIRRDFKPRVNDQGQSSSCVGQGWSQLEAIRNRIKTGQWLDISARDVYSWIYEANGGAYAYKGGSSLVNRGVAPEYLVRSYQAEYPPSEEFMRIREFDPVARNAALTHKILGYTVINPEIDDMAHAIENNGAIVLGVIGSNEGWQTGNVRPPLPGEKVWGHFFISEDKFIKNSKRTLECLNSWSKYWGDEGYFYLNEDYFASGYVYSGYNIQGISSDWLNRTRMKDLIILEGTQDQYVCESGRKLKIPDIETRDFLRDVIKIITGEPRVVKQAEFDSFQTDKPMPSVKADQFVRDAYTFYKDKLPLFKDIVDAQ